MVKRATSLFNQNKLHVFVARFTVSLGSSHFCSPAIIYANREMAIKNMTEAGSVINLDGSEDVEFDKVGNHETELMLGDHKDRRVSDAGILPTPMAQATFFSKYFSFW